MIRIDFFDPDFVADWQGGHIADDILRDWTVNNDDGLPVVLQKSNQVHPDRSCLVTGKRGAVSVLYCYRWADI